MHLSDEVLVATRLAASLVIGVTFMGYLPIDYTRPEPGPKVIFRQRPVAARADGQHLPQPGGGVAGVAVGRGQGESGHNCCRAQPDVRGALGGLLGVEFVTSCLDVIQWPGEPRSTLEAAGGAELDAAYGGVIIGSYPASVASRG